MLWCDCCDLKNPTESPETSPHKIMLIFSDKLKKFWWVWFVGQNFYSELIKNNNTQIYKKINSNPPRTPLQKTLLWREYERPYQTVACNSNSNRNKEKHKENPTKTRPNQILSSIRILLVIFKHLTNQIIRQRPIQSKYQSNHSTHQSKGKQSNTNIDQREKKGKQDMRENGNKKRVRTIPTQIMFAESSDFLNKEGLLKI